MLVKQKDSNHQADTTPVSLSPKSIIIIFGLLLLVTVVVVAVTSGPE